MFNYFHQNKFNYNERGQLAPVFIAVIVILIIMAMVTVNLSKVALFKTQSANAADAGGLAAGSAMANVFNAVAQASSQMEAFYWEFYVTTSALFALAIYYLVTTEISAHIALVNATSALGVACPVPYAASAEAAMAAAEEMTISLTANQLLYMIILSIIIAVTAYSIATYYHYLLIKDMAEEGRLNAIKMGHQFAFMNSGIGAKLKSGKPDDDETTEEEKNNYRNTFSRFLDDLGEIEKPQGEYIYAWQDAQARSHYVKTKVTIGPVDNFKLKTTILPWPTIVSLLSITIFPVVAFAYAAASSVLAAAGACQACCGPWAPGCCACWWALCAAGAAILIAGIAANILIYNHIAMVFTIIIPAWLGLLPGPVISTKDEDPFLKTICWIEDIEHDRRVRVDTWQYHQGAELGLWQTQYPETYSFSIVDFTGNGSIHPPKLRHDASIIATDILAVSEMVVDAEKNCPIAVKKVAELEISREEALSDADDYDAMAVKWEAEVTRLLAQKGMADKAEEVAASALNLRQMAAELREKADDLQEEIDRYKADYADCFVEP